MEISGFGDDWELLEKIKTKKQNKKKQDNKWNWLRKENQNKTNQTKLPNITNQT